MNVLVTGGKGFIGRNSVPILEKKYQVFAFNSNDYNLTDSKQCEKMFEDTKPDLVLHLAAKSGGIAANKLYSATFLHENMLITGNIWESSKNHQVKRILAVVPGCVYPAKATVPIREDDIWNGFPDLFPAPGALSKKQSIVASYAYKKQYGLNSTIIIPANAFGLYDLFDENKSHVIDSLMAKFYHAKKNNLQEVKLLGDGSPIRDFIYAEDLAKVIPYFLENDIDFECENPCLRNICNISTGVGTSIKELADTIAEVVGYNGEIKWSDSSLNGPANKTFSNERMKSLGLECKTPLQDGLRKTYQWYLSQLA